VNSFPEAKICVAKTVGDEVQVVPSSPFEQFFRNPNGAYDYRQLIGATVLSFLCAGDAYWLKERGANGAVKAVWYVPHFQMAPQWQDDSVFIDRYAFTVNGVTTFFDPIDVVHFRYEIDPRNTRRGLSPLCSQDRQIAGDNEASTYLAVLLENFGIPGIIVSPKAEQAIADDDAADELKALIKAKTTGDKRGEPLVWETAIDVNTLGYSPQELALDSLMNQPAERICAALGIDPMVCGLASDSKTYSNMEEARRSAWQNAILPIMAMLASELTRSLLPEFSYIEGEFVQFNTSQVLALQDDIDKLVARLVLACGGAFMTPNEARARMNLLPIAEQDKLREKSAPVQNGDKTDANAANA